MLILNALNYMAGYYKLSCNAKQSNSVINLMLKNELDYWKLKKCDDGSILFFMLKKEYKGLAQLTDSAVIEHEYGLPYFLKKQRKRIGVPIGLIICLVLLKMSTEYIWDIEVLGNSGLSDAEIIEGLEALGCSVGTEIKSIDFYGICHEYILKNEEISWISVNMIGTTARVEVIERHSKAPSENNGGNGTPTNLIAARDGSIVRVETFGGQTSCKAGEEVKKGQLLIGGVLNIGPEEEGRFILVRSRGRVYAETERRLEVRVPLISTKKVFLERENVYKYIKFFGKMIKVKENSSILTEECDIIERSRRIILFDDIDPTGGVALPLSVVNGYYEKYSETEVVLTREEAYGVALISMTELFTSELGDAEILSRTEEKIVHNTPDGEELVLVWTLNCIENIAEEVPIGVS